MPETETTTTTAPTTEGETAPETPISDSARHAEGLRKALTTERSARKELEARLAEMQEATETRKREAAEEQGRFKELYEGAQAKLTETSGRLEAIEQREAERVAVIKAKNAEAVKALPDAYQALIPAGLDPDSTAAQIAKIQALVNTPQHATGTQVNGGKPRGISEEAKREAVRMRVSPESAQRIIDARKARREA